MLDVDGVLVSGRPTDGKVWTDLLLQDLGIAPDALVREFFAKDWQDVVTGKCDLRPALSKALQRLDINITAEALISYWFEMDSRFMDPVLTDCRMIREQGVQVYLATNQEHQRARYLMHTLGLQDEVDGIIYSAEVGFQKPHIKFFDHAADVTGYAPHALLLVDDTLANIDCARHAGWRAVYWDGRERLLDIVESCM